MSVTHLERRPAGPWQPPLDSEALGRVLAAMRAWRPFDVDALLDDVGDALDHVPPHEEDAEALVQRLREHLMELVDIAIAARAERRDDQAADLIARARALRSEELPGNYQPAVRHLRRLGWTVHELLERMVKTHCVKGAA